MFYCIMIMIVVLIQRFYLQKLINVIGISDIKVVIWVRHCWKSELLLALKSYIENSIPNSI